MYNHRAMTETVYITHGEERVGPYSSSKTANVAAVTLARRMKTPMTVSVYSDASLAVLLRSYCVEIRRGHVKITSA